MKEVVLNTTNYIIYAENILYNETHPIYMTHCDVFKWNKSVKSSLQKDSKDLFEKQNKPVVCCHYKEDKKHLKFIKMMGFKPLFDEVILENGTKCMMFIWSKK